MPEVAVVVEKGWEDEHSVSVVFVGPDVPETVADEGDAVVVDGDE